MLKVCMPRLFNPSNCIKISIFTIGNELKKITNTLSPMFYSIIYLQYQQLLSHSTVVYVQITSSLLEIIYCSCHKYFVTIFILHLITLQINSFFLYCEFKKCEVLLSTKVLYV